MRFESKVVIVTGAASGIGAATAELYAKEGASVVAVDLNENALRNVTQRCNPNKLANGDAGQNGNEDKKHVVHIVANVAKDDDARRIIEETINNFGKLDILVNCAGVYRDGTIIDSSVINTFDDVLNVNLRAVIQLTTLAVPHLKKTKGSVVNISSIKAIAISTSYAYDISKVGVEHFTRRAALELGPLGVRVNAVRPGPVRTGIIENAGLDIDIEDWRTMTALDRMSDPEEIAEQILFLTDDKAKGITGSIFTHDNGTLVKYYASEIC
ncbi:3-oxoacyl-[acyl-carrier-protein] reductase FabG-like [Amyelois transitella]|uniref:3-oxoacyl-[acyl-carrier-protein] reductase FabG-like n=1 Tax=Amyelois transitella TaxID=680683 RepID=UPI00067AE384|nr:3-oxoacyl-[acyl-carrier-protein] reductase FabG-like [Amyelois transitella]